MNASPPHAPRQRRKETRPQELLDAALTLFVEKGFAATRSEEVAHAAGVSKGTLYLYYPSKEELFKAVVRQNLSNLIAEGIELAESYQGSTSDLLVELMNIWWQRFGNTPAAGIHKVVLSEVRNFPEIAEFYVRQVVEPAHRLLGQAIELGIAQGEFRAVDVADTVHSLVLPLIMLCLHRHTLGACAADWRLDPLRFIGAHVNLVLDGLIQPARAAEPERSA